MRSETEASLQRWVGEPRRRERPWFLTYRVLVIAVPTLIVLGLLNAANVSDVLPFEVLRLAITGYLAYLAITFVINARSGRRRRKIREVARAGWVPGNPPEEEYERAQVRKALHAIVGADRAALGEAITTIQDLHPDDRMTALRFLRAVAAVALVLRYELRWPDEDEMNRIVAGFAASHPHPEVDLATAYSAMALLPDDRDPARLPETAQDLAPTTWLAAWLLADPPLPGSLRWNDVLTEVEAILNVGGRFTPEPLS